MRTALLALITLVAACSSSNPYHEPSWPPPDPHFGAAAHGSAGAPAPSEGTARPDGAGAPEVTAAGATKAGQTPGFAFGNYKLVFQTSTHEWTNQIVIAPWGDVVAIGGHRATLLARDSGKVLMTVPICFVQAPDAAAFLDEHHLLVACEEGVDELTFPQGTVKQVFKFPAELALTAIGGGRLVAAADGFFVKNDSKVRVYALQDFSQVDEFDVGSPVRAVGVSSDGRLVAAGLDGKGVVVRNTTTKSSKTYLKSSDQTLSPVRFSPDSSVLFTYPSSFKGGELSLATGEVQREFEASSWIKTVRYIDANAVLLTGADGLALASGRNSLQPSPVAELGEGLDLSADGSLFCAAGRGGDTACFSKKPVAPSTFVPWQGPGSAGSPVASSSPAKVELSLDGQIVSRAGKTLVISTSAAAEAKPGMRGELLKHFTENIGFQISGQIVIATVEVKSADAGTITLTILEEKSIMTVNGKKADHFSPKSEVTVTLQ